MQHSPLKKEAQLMKTLPNIFTTPCQVLAKRRNGKKAKFDQERIKIGNKKIENNW
jgi:hypothetical protein